MKECALEMRAGQPVIIYRITYDDGEEVAHLPSLHTAYTCLSSTLTPNPDASPNPNPYPNPNPEP